MARRRPWTDWHSWRLLVKTAASSLHSLHFPLSLNVRRTWLSTDGDRAFPVAAAELETLCPNILCVQPLCLFSEVASRLSSSGVPSRDFHRNVFSACVVTVVIFRHLNHSFYLPTYLLWTETERDYMELIWSY